MTLLNHIKDERNQGYDFLQKKRNLFKARNEKYLEIDPTNKKVFDRLIHTVLETQKSIEVNDQLWVDFAIQWQFFSELEDDIKATAENDFVDMWCQHKKERVIDHKYRYWVWVEIFDWFDNVDNIPTYKVVSPLDCVIDPESDVNYWPRYLGVEMTIDRSELTEDRGYTNIDKLTEILLNKYKDNKINGNIIIPTKVWIYHHYTRYEGRAYMITTDIDCNVIIRKTEFQPHTNRETKDSNKIPLPFIIRNWCPIDWDPRWISLFDILEDKQASRQLYLNLNNQKALTGAVGDIILFDPNVIREAKHLETKTYWPKFVPADLNRWQGIYQLPTQPITKDAYNIPNILKQQAFLDLWLDERWLWVSWDSNITATENQRVQANSNLRQMLWMTRDARAEEYFWSIWYRMYQVYFTGKKVFNRRLETWSDFYELTKSALVTYEHIKVDIISWIKRKEQKNKNQALFMAILPTILQDPNVSKVAKIKAQRENLRLNDINREIIFELYPYTTEELKAMDWLELINRNESVPPITDLNEDHHCYISIYQRAKDTDSKYRAITDRQNALKLSWQSNSQPIQQGSNAVQNQVVNQMLSKSNDTQSLETIKSNG